jgi:hypothetical protein
MTTGAPAPRSGQIAPTRAMMISSPAAAWSTSLERFVFAS